MLQIQGVEDAKLKVRSHQVPAGKVLNAHQICLLLLLDKCMKRRLLRERGVIKRWSGGASPAIIGRQLRHWIHNHKLGPRLHAELQRESSYNLQSRLEWNAFYRNPSKSSIICRLPITWQQRNLTDSSSVNLTHLTSGWKLSFAAICPENWSQSTPSSTSITHPYIHQ